MAFRCLAILEAGTLIPVTGGLRPGSKPRWQKQNSGVPRSSRFLRRAGVGDACASGVGHAAVGVVQAVKYVRQKCNRQHRVPPLQRTQGWGTRTGADPGGKRIPPASLRSRIGMTRAGGDQVHDFDLAGTQKTVGCPVLRAFCEGRVPRTLGAAQPMLPYPETRSRSIPHSLAPVRLRSEDRNDNCSSAIPPVRPPIPASRDYDACISTSRRAFSSSIR